MLVRIGTGNTDQMTTVESRVRSRATKLIISCLLIATMVGCGSGSPYDVVPLSGTVTLDDKPLPNARIVFQPIRTPRGTKDVGPGSYGRTDASGQFQLETIDEHEGAVVGTHMVRVTTSDYNAPAERDDGVITGEKVPPWYHQGFTMEVAESTDAFAIKLSTTPPAK